MSNPRTLACAATLLFAQLASAQNTSIHTTFLWHLHQPVYWPDKRSASDHYENAWDTIQQQDAGRGHPFAGESLRTIFGLDDRVNAYQWRPQNALSSITWLGKAGVQVNFSGALMENVQSMAVAGQLGYVGNWYQYNKDEKGWLTSGGKPRMDMTNFTYHHSLAPLLSDETLEMELRIHMRQAQIFWGDPASKGFFPAETCFSEHIIPVLKKVGINWSVVANNHLTRSC